MIFFTLGSKMYGKKNNIIKPFYSEHILRVPWSFIILRFYCKATKFYVTRIWLKKTSHNTMVKQGTKVSNFFCNIAARQAMLHILPPTKQTRKVVPKVGFPKSWKVLESRMWSLKSPWIPFFLEKSSNFCASPWKVLELSSTLNVVAWKVFFNAFWLLAWTGNVHLCTNLWLIFTVGSPCKSNLLHEKSMRNGCNFLYEPCKVESSSTLYIKICSLFK